ncbi:hypothetical protein DHW03_04020 [Pedobacter yonginense]|uniref:Uncharacterized protein n=1 Tax=Pedobacter yonginense TaxID=651869 RepID=A0A317EV05_9SPHI|nr:hypothetical protein DHW03_04020 [Pedobacter yonginense]
MDKKANSENHLARSEFSGIKKRGSSSCDLVPRFYFKNNLGRILKHLIFVTLIFPMSLGSKTFAIRENLFPTDSFRKILQFSIISVRSCDFLIFPSFDFKMYILTRFNPF